MQHLRLADARLLSNLSAKCDASHIARPAEKSFLASLLYFIRYNIYRSSRPKVQLPPDIKN